MKRTRLVKLPVLVLLGILWQGGLVGPARAGTCPSPLPTCTSSGTLSNLSGTFSCTEVQTNANGVVSTSLIVIISDGAGNITGHMAKNSNDSGTTTTFQDFSAITATYCINTNDTGYLTPNDPSGSSCPLAFIMDSTKTEVRLLESTEQHAGTVVCRKQ